ncbi:hypothetical protein FDP41_008464 [Naegleria fowleri]|uniref:Uncharacterized protein n=1 Tax=Naegleria fowleri TaxID=5763 RepID=A0A6A5B6E7_NAEFO|nr:uncharacterized protein FDP41_008464 [Naegleria fowleri]KAF0973257.1 hypothetical protein FDP41_008464 [Naegleria fowleri]CAG4711944.1 unnamed protein product [Naegleria fowleri]
MRHRQGFQNSTSTRKNNTYERPNIKRKDEVNQTISKRSQQQITPNTNQISPNSVLKPQSSAQQSHVQKQNIIVHQKLRYPPIRHELLKYYGIRNIIDDDQIADVIFPSLRLAFIVVGIENIVLPNYSEQVGIKNIALPSVSQYRSFSSTPSDLSMLRKATLEDICTIGSIFERSFVLVMINNKNQMGKLLVLQKMLTSHVIQRQTNREMFLKSHDDHNPSKRKREDPNSASKCDSSADTDAPAPYRPPQVLPCSSTGKMIQCIQELSKVEGRKQRVKHSEQELAEFMNQHQANAERAFVNSPIAHGLSSYEASVLLQGMGSVSKVILCQSPQEIIARTPLEREKATLIFDFFNPPQENDKLLQMQDEENSFYRDMHLNDGK